MVAAEASNAAEKRIGVAFVEGRWAVGGFSLRHGWLHERGHAPLDANGSTPLFIRHC